VRYVVLTGLFLTLLAACGCKSNENSGSTSLSPGDLAQVACETYLARQLATGGGTRDPTNEIYPRSWTDGIKAL